ncbi:glutaminyl-tRNA ligase [Moraxella macacae 0408225]|uniref:Glutamine--tRNA ligase n=1 Tax=Moraxella macacae 0408225 TaxID=1230338 RepID=L2F5D9_9GAMM|nr:glutamine--tRNA ligase/YqeY domain fusion protein [Moraxella macacae]ELA08242.1 glutaminyl-tRNA ligase [Moraxella macacae 0408225]
MTNPTENTEKNDFIRTIVRDDLANNKHEKIVTRFPPEPNGYLHLGHVKSICLNFGLAKEFGGLCNLRFDDTNPNAEDQEYVDNIKDDVRWLGFDWAGDVHYASNYFAQLYQWAVQLIEQGDAYVDLQTPEQIRENRGNFAKVGKNSPYRDASVAENLARFDDMKNGKFNNGEAVLRAKIDMASPNMNLRDPVIYRVMHSSHHQTGDAWCIYPMYDYAHPLSDAIEGVTHSVCTLEFEDHRPFYDWVIEKIGFKKQPHQYEFARLNVNHILTSKRKLKKLVDDNLVTGWDDPRMPTIAGMRRRGYTPQGLLDFCDRVGVSKADGVVDFNLLEFSIRNALEDTTNRAMAVLNPLKVTIVNFNEAVAKVEILKKPTVKTRLDKDNNILWLTQPKNSHDESQGMRDIPFTATIFIDKNDYNQNPPNGYKRLSPTNSEIRLRNSYVLKIEQAITDDNGEVVELIATIDPKTLGNNPEGRKVKGVIHWVSASCGIPATVRLYEQLFNQEDPAKVDLENLAQEINPNSLTTVNAVVEPSLLHASPGDRFQFEREGFFVADCQDFSKEHLVFNRIVGLKDGFK